MDEEEKNLLVIIMGMHRSGTSYLIRALNLCGLHLGPESEFIDSELKPNVGNPRGHWENFRVLKLNEEILKINGGSWDKIPDDIRKSPSNIEWEIKKILDSFFTSHALAYGFKDPRFSITLEKWIPYLSQFIIVGIFRHPLKVAESLKIRNGFPYSESLRLWEEYNKKLLSYLKENKGFLIDFDLPKEQLLKETRIVARKIGLPEVDISSWFSEEFRRSDRSFAASFPLPETTLAIYSELKELAKNNRKVKIPIPKIKKTKYAQIIQDLITYSNSVYDKTFKQAQSEINKIKTESQTDLHNDPINQLLLLYHKRNDLKKSFPEVSMGDFSKFIGWANSVCNGHAKGEVEARQILLKFSKWFENIEKERIIQRGNEQKSRQNEITQYKNSIASLEKDRVNLKDEITQYKNTTASLEEDRVNLKDEITQYKNSIASLEKDRVNLKDEITQYKNTTASLEEDRVNLKDEITQYKNSIASLEEDRVNLKDEITQYKNSIAALEEERVNLKDEITQYKNSIAALEEERVNLRYENSLYKNELNAIKSGLGFKITRFFGSKIDKISGNSIMKGIKPLMESSAHIIKTEGISSLVTHAKEKINRREFAALSPQLYKTIPQPLESDKGEKEAVSYVESDEEKEIYSSKFKASVVIPTNSSDYSLRRLIDKINLQKGIEDLEVIIVNSGSSDLKSLGEIPNVKILQIDSKDFNHGKSRNIGAANASHDYVIFLTDDAIPATNHLFYDMCKVLSGNPKVAVATARQIPRSDCDLMSSYSLKYFYDFLELNNDRVTSCKDFDKLTPSEKRRVAQIDDVCSCYKHDLLLKYGFKEIQYAEDLDIGIRLVRDGYKIAQLFSNGVIHSHSRPASYYLKRQFVETKVLSTLLGYELPDFKKFGILDSKKFMDNAYSLYNSIGLSIDFIKENPKNEISVIFDLLSKKIPEFCDSKIKSKSSDSSLEKIFENIHVNDSLAKSKENFLLTPYLLSLHPFKNFLSHSNLMNTDEDFFNSLYKIFGSVVGNSLGSFLIYSKKYNLNDYDLKNIEKLLTSGI